MQTCKSILDIKWNIMSLVAPPPLLTTITRQKVARAMVSLEQICQRHTNFQPPTDLDFRKTYHLFMEHALLGSDAVLEVFRSPNDIQRLAWTLDYVEGQNMAIIHSDYLPTALTVLERGRRPSMIGILHNMLLKHWTDLHLENKKILISFLKLKLDAYKGRRTRYLRLKSNQHYFLDFVGAVQLAQRILQENKSLLNALNEFATHESEKKYQFWGQVANSFTQTALRKDSNQQYIDDIIDFLKVHNNSTTSKQCLSKIILRASERPSEELKEQLQFAAFRLIGDPAQAAYWLPWKGANHRQKHELQQARELINNWIAGEFINLFFAHSYVDDDRKEFWLQYTKHVTSFKIYSGSPSSIKRKFREEDRGIAGKRIGELKGGPFGLSALVLEVKGYILVEFSSKGNAFYAYKKSNPSCPDISVTSLTVTDLKDTQALELIRRDELRYKAEGRLRHDSGWEYYFANWLAWHVGV